MSIERVKEIKRRRKRRRERLKERAREAKTRPAAARTVKKSAPSPKEGAKAAPRRTAKAKPAAGEPAAE